MNSKQEMVAFMGLFLIGLTIWQSWKDEVKAILFDVVPSDIPRTDVGSPLVNQFGQSDPNGQFTQQPGYGNVPPGSTNLVPLI